MIIIDCLDAVKTSRKQRCGMFYNYGYETMKAKDLRKERIIGNLGCILKFHVIVTCKYYCNGQGFHRRRDTLQSGGAQFCHKNVNFPFLSSMVVAIQLIRFNSTPRYSQYLLLTTFSTANIVLLFCLPCLTKGLDSL